MFPCILYLYLLNSVCITCVVIASLCFGRYSPEEFIDKGIEYAEIYIRGTAREPPDFVVSEVRQFPNVL